MTTTASTIRTAIETHCNVYLGWERPASQCRTKMRFVPMRVSDYLCDLSPDIPVGAVNTYVWSMAFAETRETAALALRNLASLLDGIVDFGEDYN